MMKTVGWPLLLIALPLLFILFLRLLESAQKSADTLIAAFVLVIMLSLHLQRKDFGFLKKVNPKFQFIFLAEYQLFILPLSLVFLLFLGKWQAFLWIHLGLIVIPFLPVMGKNQKLNKSLRLSIIPTGAFELKGGIRKYWYILLLFYLPGIALAKFEAAPLISIILFPLMAVSFYDEFESRHLIEPFYNKRNWFAQKSWLQIRTYWMLHIPQMLAFLFFHLELWYLLLAALLIGVMLLLFALSYKYASYVPNRKKVYNQTAFGFYLIGFFIPFFFPASLFYLVVYYRRARKRMDYFFKS